MYVSADKELSEALRTAKANGQAYDFVNTSNVFDSIPKEFRDGALKAVAECLAPGGIAIFRTGPIDVYSAPDRAFVSQYLTVDNAVSDHLKQNEKFLIYYDMILARKPTATK